MEESIGKSCQQLLVCQYNTDDDCIHPKAARIGPGKLNIDQLPNNCITLALAKNWHGTCWILTKPTITP